MNTQTNSSSPAHIRHIVRLVALAVAMNGLIIIAGSLIDQFTVRGLRLHIQVSDDALFGAPLIIGLTLLYLSSLLARRKQVAWVLATGVYTATLLLGVAELLHFSSHGHLGMMHLLRNIIIPAVVLGGLLLSRHDFTVKSDIQSFRQSLGFIVIILLVTFAYGVTGFMLMDKRDFHHEIAFGEAVHRTIDQFGLTTNNHVVPHTRRARLFVDSLSVISVGALAYALISLVQPLKARFHDQSHNREAVRSLLETYPASSEDFFKLWPHDKQYFFDDRHVAALALHVKGGVALVVGDPAGRPARFPALLKQFTDMCEGNDWLPAFIHTEPQFNKLYEKHGFSLQKIGEEAVVNLAHFKEHVATNKNFRYIRNKFTKNGYVTEVLMPPHNDAVLARLQAINQEWLTQPGRSERGFMMGYFSDEYLQQCCLVVVRDAAGTIQGFINELPSFDKTEANFDFLRQTKHAPTNLNDFLMLAFIAELSERGFERLNMGLCPLVGLEKTEDESVIDSALRFVYSNGDRFYSFSGLQRFKSKYEPEWSDRYIAYRGGIRGFTRTMSALNRAMKVKQ